MQGIPQHVVLPITAVSWACLELWRSRNTRPEAVKADGGSLFVLRAAYLVTAALAVIADRLVPAVMPDRAIVGWAGIGVLWCGIGLRVWSFRVLGRYFTYTVQTSGDQPVISTGPYRVVRHPSYTGLLLAVVGIALVVGYWPSLVLIPLGAVAGLAYRIHVEERALLASLGERYREFAATRKRLVPFVW